MFLTLKLPRTGSTMFQRVVRSHPEIWSRHEFLNDLSDASHDEKYDYLRAYFAELNEKKAARGLIVGGSLNPFKYHLQADAVARAIGPDVDVVLLVREDALRQAVSIYMARERGTYASSRDEIGAEHGADHRRFDLDELAAITVETDRKSRAISDFTAAVSRDHLRVSYEDLVADPEGTYGRVFAHVGAAAPEPGFDYTAGFTKVLSSDLADVIDNYDELEDHEVLRRFV